MAAKTKAKTPAKRGPGAPAKYNWDLAQQYFIEGMPVDEDDPDGDRDWPNLRVLSERMGIPYERVRERSAKFRWADLKHRHQQEAAKERMKKRQEKMGRQSIEFDERSLGIAQMGLQLIGVRMTEIGALVKANKQRRDEAVERLANGQPVDRQELWSQVRADEMERLAKAASTLQEIGRKALGTDVQQINIDQNVQVEAAISVAAELERDDPDRLAAFFAAADRAGIFEQLAAAGELEAGEEEIVDGELVEEEGSSG